MKKALLFTIGFALLATSCGGAPKTHTVTFEYNYTTSSGATNIVKTVNDGETTTLPVLERSGYTLEGWFEDNNVWTVAFDASKPIKADVTVYAKWVDEAQKYKVNAEEWAAATSEVGLSNVKLDLKYYVGAKLVSSASSEQEGKKAYGVFPGSGGTVESYIEKVDSAYYTYEKDAQGKWTKKASEPESVLPSEQYSAIFAGITFSENAYEEAIKGYAFDTAGGTLMLYFLNKKLVKFTLDQVQVQFTMRQEVNLSKYGEITVTLPTVA